MKRLFAFLISVLIVASFVLPASAAQIPAERLKPRLVDDADLLTEDEEEKLLSKLDEISERQQYDIVVVTTYSLDGKSAMAYADDFYDYNGYGFGKSRDGILLLLSMEYRDWWMSTCGKAIDTFTDEGQSYMSDDFLEYISDGEYYDGFIRYAELCDEFITQDKNGDPYDVGNMPKEPLPLYCIPLSIGIGALISLVVVMIMKGKLKTVRAQNLADSYVRTGSMNISTSRDMFLYKNVTKTKRESSSSGGGSSTHTSSSGTSHGGSGGKF